MMTVERLAAQKTDAQHATSPDRHCRPRAGNPSLLRKKMDARDKPAHDEWPLRAYSISA
jgi:hypothetical protein